MSEVNRVWIEIEPGADDAESHHRAELVNRMIAKLHHNDEDRKLMQTFEWSPHHQKFTLRMGPSGMYKELTDNGEWFNLDYYGTDPE